MVQGSAGNASGACMHTHAHMGSMLPHAAASTSSLHRPTHPPAHPEPQPPAQRTQQAMEPRVVKPQTKLVSADSC